MTPATDAPGHASTTVTCTSPFFGPECKLYEQSTRYRISFAKHFNARIICIDIGKAGARRAIGIATGIVLATPGRGRGQAPRRRGRRARAAAHEVVPAGKHGAVLPVSNIKPGLSVELPGPHKIIAPFYV